MVGGSNEFMVAMSIALSWGLMLAVSVASAGGASASQKPPASAKPLKEVVMKLEKDGYKVVEGAYDDGRWELEGYRNGLGYQVWVEGDTGKVLSEQRDDADPPPAEAKPLSEIVDLVERAGYTPIISAEFEHGRWEIEAYRGATKHELQVHATTGKVLSDRVDQASVSPSAIR